MNSGIRNGGVVLALALALSACSLVNSKPAMDVQAAGSTYGVGGTAAPGGTASISIGATQLRAIIAPTVYTDANGQQQKLLAPNLCGAESVPSIWGTSSVGTSAGIGAGSAPSASLSNGEGMAVGLPADLEALADLQKAAGASNNVLRDCTGK